MALGIKQEGDRYLIGAMVVRADVFIQNFAPGAADWIGCKGPAKAISTTDHMRYIGVRLLRARTGEGASLEVSLFDVAAKWMTAPLIHSEFGAGCKQRRYGC